jgi:protein involved in plasmid replication-relaxation
VKTKERSLANRSLSEAAIETIDALHQHRLLTTSQIREMVLPGRSLRRMQQVPAELVRRGLVDWVAARGQWPGPAERVWFLTKRGGAVVNAVPNKAEPRLRLVSPEQASGRLQSHTLAVNQIGIAFMRVARQRHEDFDIRSWRHEIAHDIAIGRRRRLVIADAVLRYWATSPQDEMVLSYRFLELDRATLPIEDLLAKLRRYVDLRRCWDDYRQADSTQRERMPAWPSRYLALPSLMVVFANPDRGSPRLRMRNAMTLCRHAREIMRNPGWIFFALFDELVASGPFGAVFRRLDGEGIVNWLGEPSGIEGQAA